MFFLASILTYKIKVFMANLFPEPFLLLNTPEMERPGRQVEFELYTKLWTTYYETVDVYFFIRTVRPLSSLSWQLLNFFHH